MKIKPFQKKDCQSILTLIQELATFEKEPNAVEINVEDLERDGFGDNPKFQGFVAEVENKIVGIALFYERYSTWKGTTLHLEDLIVTQSMRNKGIGSALYKAFLSYAYEKKVRRVEWAVLDWNTHAIDFYKKTGATILKDWRVAQMTYEQLKKYFLK